MKRLIYIAVVLMITAGCANSKSGCEAYGSDNYLVEQIIIPLPEYTLLYHDTIQKPTLYDNDIIRIWYLIHR